MPGRKQKIRHRHITLLNSRRTRQSQVYPRRLCMEIVKGLVGQLVEDGRMVKGGGMMGSIEMPLANLGASGVEIEIEKKI